MAAAGKHLAEAEEYMKKAEKSLKTSLIGLKFQPDFDSAADFYSKAALSFKNAEATERSKEMYVKSAEYALKNNSRFHAAKAYENAAALCRQKNDWANMVQLMEQAADLHSEAGAPDSATSALDKAAKMIELDSPGKAAELLIKAAKIAGVCDKIIQQMDYLERAAHCFAKSEHWDHAAKLLPELLEQTRESPTSASSTCRAIAALVIIALHKKDYVAGRKAYDLGLSFEQFNGSPIGSVCARLLNAYDVRNYEELNDVLNESALRGNIDVAYYRLAMTLKQPIRAAKQPDAHHLAAALDEGDASAQAEEEEEFDLT